MEKNFFGLQIEKLRGVYSPTAMNEARVQLFWDRFKGVPNHVFENAVNFLIRMALHTCKSFNRLSRANHAVISDMDSLVTQ